jgi:hypothetical protein
MGTDMKILNTLAISALSFGLCTAGAVAGPNGSMAIVEGAPAPNSYAGEIPQALEQWCVLIGGTEGEVLPGTGKYANAGGAYATRLKLEADEFGNIVYYDELFFRFREVKLD